MKKPYYLKVLITYIDMLSYKRKFCYCRVAYEQPQINMLFALHDVITTFYAENQCADVIDIYVTDNYLYERGEQK